MKKNEKNILLINAHAPNKGDLAIIQAITDSLFENLSEINISISIMSYQYAPNIEGVEIVHSLPIMENSKFKILLKIILFPLSKYFQIFLKFFSESEKIVIMKYINSDIIISVGGHHFTDIIGLYTFFIQWYQLFLATILNKPIVIYSQTIGPFKKSSYVPKFLTKILLKRSELIMVREKKSFDFICNNLKINHSNLYLTADTAFLLKPKIDYEKFIIYEQINKKKLKIGITVYHTPHYYSGKEKTFEKYKIFMSEICDYLIKNFNAEIIFIPMEMDYWADIPLIHNIIDMMVERDKVKVLRNIYDAKETMAIIGHMDLIIATKTHSLIFALAQSTPVFCIAYNYKSHEFMRSFDLEKYSFSIDDLDYNIAQEAIIDLIYNRTNIKMHLTSNINKIHEKAKLNIELFNNMFYNE